MWIELTRLYDIFITESGSDTDVKDFKEYNWVIAINDWVTDEWLEKKKTYH